MGKPTKKKQETNWLALGAAALVVTGGLYYGVRQVVIKKGIVAKRASIDIVNPASLLVKLHLSRTKLPVRVGQTGSFSLVADVYNGNPITGLEGKLYYNPKMVTITSVKPSKSLPVTLKKWRVKKINDNVAEVSFAYGARPGMTPRPEIKRTTNNSEKNYKRVEKSNPNFPGVPERSPLPPIGGMPMRGNAVLLTVNFKALKVGSTAISFPKDKLKLATFNRSGNSFDAKNSKLQLMVSITNKPIPSPKPIITPKPTPQAVIYDLNKDGKVDILDYNLFLREFGKTGTDKADFNKDRVVDVLDYNMLLRAIRTGTFHYPRYDGGPVRAY